MLTLLIPSSDILMPTLMSLAAADIGASVPMKSPAVLSATLRRMSCWSVTRRLQHHLRVGIVWPKLAGDSLSAALLDIDGCSDRS